MRELTCVSPLLKVYDYPAWYEERQKELEEAFPPILREDDPSAPWNRPPWKIPKN